MELFSLIPSHFGSRYDPVFMDPISSMFLDPFPFSPSRHIAPRASSFFGPSLLSDFFAPPSSFALVPSLHAMSSALDALGLDDGRNSHSMSFYSSKQGDGPVRARAVVDGKHFELTPIEAPDPDLCNAASEKAALAAHKKRNDDWSADAEMSQLANDLVTFRGRYAPDLQGVYDARMEANQDAKVAAANLDLYISSQDFNSTVTEKAKGVSHDLASQLSKEGKTALDTLQSDASNALHSHWSDNGDWIRSNGRLISYKNLGGAQHDMVAILKNDALGTLAADLNRIASAKVDSGEATKGSELATTLLSDIKTSMRSLIDGSTIPSWRDRQPESKMQVAGKDDGSSGPAATDEHKLLPAGTTTADAASDLPESPSAAADPEPPFWQTRGELKSAMAH